MEYRNPDIPEGINYSREHPLKEFVLLSGGLLLVTVIAALVLVLFAERLAGYVPFSAELKIVELHMKAQPVQPAQPIETYLQNLADRLARAEGMPPDMKVVINYQDSELVNAFATLGGRIVMFRGLLEQMPDENSVAMVLGHEIAHIKYRHPIRSMGRGIVLGVAMTLFSTAAGNDMVSHALGETGLLTALKFSRDQERQADNAALTALHKVYGHVGGSEGVLRLLQQQNRGRMNDVEFFNSHPLTEDRISALALQASRQGWPTDGRRGALPPEFMDWLATTESPPAR